MGRIFDIAAHSKFFVSVSDLGEVYSSSNTGVSWFQSSQLAATLYGITIGSNGKSYAVGISNITQNSTIYSSSNISSYSSWTEFTSIAQSTAQLNGVSTFDGVAVFAVGSNGVMYSTTNSGQNWTLLYPASILCPGVDFYSVSVSKYNAGINMYNLK